MRAILIEEERFAEVAQLMRAEAISAGKNHFLRSQLGIELTERQMEFAADAISRAIHFHFVRWAQSHGASCVQS
jgi:hypothetical protein